MTCAGSPGPGDPEGAPDEAARAEDSGPALDERDGGVCAEEAGLQHAEEIGPGVTSNEFTLLAAPAPAGGTPPEIEPLAGPLHDLPSFPGPARGATAGRTGIPDHLSGPPPDHPSIGEPAQGATVDRLRSLDPLSGPLVDRTRFPDPMESAMSDRGRRPLHENDVDSPAHSGARREAGRRAGARAAEIRRAPDATTLAPLSVPVVTPSRPAAAAKTLASFWAFGG